MTSVWLGVVSLWRVLLVTCVEPGHTRRQPGDHVTMLYPRDVTVVNASDDVELDCHFHMTDFNMFDNPVLWTKWQRGESTAININGNIEPPFLDTDRFDVNLSQSPPDYNLQLYIRGVRAEDSGNYTCHVRGERSAVLGTATVRLYVRAPVQAIAVTSENGTAMTPRTNNVLAYTEYRPGTLRCISLGGYPPPDMQLIMGDNTNITERFSLTYSSSLSGSKGLRTMVYRTERWSHDFTVTGADDGKSVRCVVTVPGLTPSTALIRLHVPHSPTITCINSSARPGDFNVHVRCEVRARPRVTALFWIVDVNGTRIQEGQVVDDHWSLVKDVGDNVLETRLFLKRATPDSFRRYTLVAQNSLGKSTTEVQLYREDDVRSQTSLSANVESPLSETQRNNPEYQLTHSLASPPVHINVPLVVIIPVSVLTRGSLLYVTLLMFSLFTFLSNTKDISPTQCIVVDNRFTCFVYCLFGQNVVSNSM